MSKYKLSFPFASFFLRNLTGLLDKSFMRNKIIKLDNKRGTKINKIPQFNTMNDKQKSIEKTENKRDTTNK